MAFCWCLTGNPADSRAAPFGTSRVLPGAGWNATVGRGAFSRNPGVPRLTWRASRCSQFRWLGPTGLAEPVGARVDRRGNLDPAASRAGVLNSPTGADVTGRQPRRRFIVRWIWPPGLRGLEAGLRVVPPAGRRFTVARIWPRGLSGFVSKRPPLLTSAGDPLRTA